MKANFEAGTKYCYKCGRVLSIDSFSKDSSRNDGLTAVCKICNRVWFRKPRKYHYDKEKKAKYYQKNKEKINAQKKDWVSRNRERVNQGGQRFRAAHPGYEAARHKIYRETHREQLKEMERERNKIRKAKIREWNLQRKYGMSVNEFDSMLNIQNNRCALCEIELNTQHNTKCNFAVDHDHITGKVRGILCTKCNTALGMVNDNVNTLKHMIMYLERKEDDENSK